MAKSQKELAEIKARELGNAVTAMENGPDETNRAFIISQRHLISLKSNELNLIRRYKAMSEVESHLRKQNTSLQVKKYRNRDRKFISYKKRKISGHWIKLPVKLYYDY